MGMLASGEIQTFDKFLHSRLTFLCAGPYWQLKVTLCCVVTALFFSLPSYDRFFSDQHDYQLIWTSIAKQVDHPFTPANYDRKDHAAKIAFRLLPPLLGNLIPFGSSINKVAFIFFLQQVAGFFFYFLLIKWAYRFSGNAINAFLFTYSIVFIYLGRSFFYEFYPFFDGLVFFFMIASLYVRRPHLSFLILFLAYWVDERAVIASPLFLLFKLTESRTGQLHLIDSLRKKHTVYLPYIISLLVYAAIRIGLGRMFHLEVPVGDNADAGIAIIYKQIIHLPLALFLTYEGHWCLMIWLTVCYIATRRMTELILTGLFFTIVVIVSCCVWDVTRSLCYGFPILLIAFKELNRYHGVVFVRMAMSLILLVSFLIPTYKYHFHNFFWQIPALVKLVYHWGS